MYIQSRYGGVLECAASSCEDVESVQVASLELDPMPRQPAS